MSEFIKIDNKSDFKTIGNIQILKEIITNLKRSYSKDGNKHILQLMLPGTLLTMRKTWFLIIDHYLI